MNHNTEKIGGVTLDYDDYMNCISSVNTPKEE